MMSKTAKTNRSSNMTLLSQSVDASSVFTERQSSRPCHVDETHENCCCCCNTCGCQYHTTRKSKPGKGWRDFEKTTQKKMVKSNGPEDTIIGGGSPTPKIGTRVDSASQQNALRIMDAPRKQQKIKCPNCHVELLIGEKTEVESNSEKWDYSDSLVGVDKSLDDDEK